MEQGRSTAKLYKGHVKRLVIGHYSARYEDLSELHREAEAVFPGTILGNEGTVIPV